MRISYEWLGDFVDLDGVTPKDAADVLTRQGVEVESLVMVDLSQIVIGKVIEQVKHPKSRNDLWVHQVDLGGRVQQIIAGAPNAVAGSLVPVALPGTTVPNGKVVKDMNIAGYQASGMLCSAAELLLGDDHAGILILDRGTPGQPLTTVIPSQAVMEAEVTSNRPDCMGHLGIARELAAGLDRPMKRDFMPAFTGTADPAGREMVNVGIEDPDLCSRYIGGVITGVTVGPSPDWMQRRLRAAGVRPINNIVDITNYVLLEYAQPLHAFDLAKLEGPAIEVRRARGKEKLLGLDGVERELTAEMLVIADARKPVALAGVIGGEETAVTEATADILLESATFSGPSVRQTSRALGLRTEASARFERALPPELALAGARRAASLIAEIAGGQVHRDWADVYPRPQEPVRVNIRPALIDDVLGTHVPLEEAEAILKRLSFHVKVRGDGEWDALRTSLLPSLVDGVALNRDRARDDVRIYEIAAAFLARVGEKNAQPEEPLRLAAVATAGPSGAAGEKAFREMKSVLDGCVASLHAPACTYQRAAAQLFHPGRCAAVVLDGRQLGYLGELHPTVVGGTGRVVAFEIDVEPVLAASRTPRAQPLARYPAVARDLAVVVEETVAAGTVLQAIKESGGELLEQARAFDEYHGAQVPEGHKSIAFTLTFRSPERTLTDAKVDEVMSEIKLGLEKRHRARFRE